MHANLDLDSAPTTDEGYVQEIEMEFVKGTAYEEEYRICQECGDKIRITESHVRATVWVYTDTRMGERMSIPTFCDRDCWCSWASSN